MSSLIDTHCHLDLFEGISTDPVKEDNYGIKTITVTNAPSFFPKNKSLFESAKNIRVALGLHPQLISQYGAELSLIEKYIESTKYIGEIGLDGSPELKTTFINQVLLFERILAIVKKNEPKVLTIHSRNAATETIEKVWKTLGRSNHRIIFHWFSGTQKELEKAINYGFYFSVNHKMATSAKGQGIIEKIPNKFLLTETDAPFTYSNEIKTREKSLLLSIARISKIKSITQEECKSLIYKNFRELIAN